MVFSRSCDLRAAFLGYRLGPQDVDACPVSPATPQVAERNRQGRFATIEGESGSGKSITAFQAARELNSEGWGILELNRPGVATEETVRNLQAVPGPVVAIVDDAQALGPEVQVAFERAVSLDHGVILVRTDRVPGADRVRVSTNRVSLLSPITAERIRMSWRRWFGS